jgi:hypothetical protein
MSMRKPVSTKRLDGWVQGPGNWPVMSDETPLEPQKRTSDDMATLPSITTERRATIRRPCLRIGKVIIAGSDTVHACVLCDFSDDGARIKLRAEVELPEHIFIYDMKQTNATPARIVWRDGEIMGVAWTGPHEPMTIDASRTPALVTARLLAKKTR